MKALPHLLLLALAPVSLAQDEALPDPTLASPQLRTALMVSDSAIPEISIKGLVVGKSTVAMLEVAGGGRVLVRPGSAFTVTTEGISRRLIFRQLTAEGLEIEAPGEKEVAVIPTFGPVDNLAAGTGVLSYVEFRDLPLIDALRMLADQSGRNYSASADANKIPVNVLLREVPADTVVEEITKSHGLWSKRDPVSGIVRIMTLGEFEKDLAGFREEQTEIFTLKYPNVAEIAVAIEDLFGDRVQLSLGAEEKDDDMRRDLEERFDRFDILTERTQVAGAMNGTILGNNVNGVASYGGRNYGIGGFNRDSYDDRNSYSRRRSDRRDIEREQRRQGREADPTLPMTAAQAERIEQALVAAAAGRRGGPDVDALRGRPSTIYVTASRRNNMIIVRTADARALEEIRGIVHQLDVQTPIVLLEVKVLSIELGKGFESAFEYAVSDGRFGGSFSTGVINPSVARDPITNAPVGVIPMPGVGSTGLRDGQFIFQYLGDSVRARLQLLAKKNRVKTIATPTLLTANNEVSRLFLGEERPLVRGISSQTIITDNNVATTPNTETEFRNVGNTLLITPNINADRTVTLRLVQENSFISPNAANIPVVTTGETDDDNNGILPGIGNNNNRRNVTGVRQVPVDVVGTRSVSGTFVAKDGMAVAIGGLIEEVDNDRREGVPILSDIPGLGVLFRRQNTEKSRRELVIILRPYVMSTPRDSERISHDLLDRLAPESVIKLEEEGFLPARTEVVTTEVIETRPAIPVEVKETVTVKKIPQSR